MLGASVVAQRAALAGLAVKAEWMADGARHRRGQQAAIRDAVAAIPGLSIPVWPSHGNFLVIETVAPASGPRRWSNASTGAGIMIRQGTYHTARFGDRFVKVSTSVPRGLGGALLRPAAGHGGGGPHAERRAGAQF